MKLTIIVLLLLLTSAFGQTMKQVEKAAKARAKSEGDRPVVTELACTPERTTTTIIRVMSENHYRMTSESSHLLHFSKPLTDLGELPFWMMPVGGRNVTLDKQVNFLMAPGNSRVELSGDIEYIANADRQNLQVTRMNGNWRWRYELETLVSAITEAARISCATTALDVK
ncbi:MAG TPA: hypothetical protein VJQ50_09580 [Terriglobales bacterium]|nr:hypothetical protein [Terriglobales bacterium]